MGKMPDNCNGLVRLDPNLDFIKINCKWAYVAQGRPRTGVEKTKKNPNRRRRIKNPKTLCINIEQEHYDYIKKMAQMRSQETGEIVQPNDLIREGLQKQFPCPQLFDLFGGRKK